MTITKFKAENYLALEKVDVEFSKGFNILTGQIGQGKSSVLNSFGYLLFSYAKDGSNIEDLINWNANGFDVSLAVEHLGKHFLIKSSYERKSKVSKKLLNIDNSATNTEGATAVKDELAKWFDPILGRASIIHTQGNNDVVKDSPSNRRDYLKRVYDLNFNSQIELVNFEITELDTKIDTVSKELYLLENKSFEPEQLPEPKLTEAEVKELILQRQNYMLLQARYDEKEANLKKYRAESESLISTESTTLASITTFKTKVADAQKKIASNQALLESKDYLKPLTELLENFPKKEEKALESIKTVTDSLAQVQIKRLPVFDVANREQAIKDKNTADYEVRRLTERHNALKLGVCPTCSRPYESNDIEKAKADLDEAIVKFNLTVQTVAGLDEEFKKYNEEVKAQEEAKSQKAVLEAKLEGLNRELTQLRDNFATQKDTVEKAVMKEKENIEVSSQNEADKIKDSEERVDFYNMQIDDNRKKLTELQKQITGLESSNLVSYQSTIDDINRAENEYNEYLLKVKLIEENNQKLVKDQEENCKNIEAKKKEHHELSLKRATLQTVVTNLRKDFPNFVLSRITKEIEDEMNNFLNEAYEGRYNVKFVETTNGIAITYGPRDFPINLASGGEECLFQLALKIAFTKISGLRVLILDEIDHFMDVDTARKAFTLLNKLYTDGELDQIFVITHSDTTKDLFLNEFSAKMFEISDGVLKEF